MAHSLGFKSQVNFGRKYRGLYIETILKLDPSWILWVEENTDHKFRKTVLERAIKFVDLMEKTEY